MKYRGLVDKNGEHFAYLQGDQLFTLDHDLSGRVEEGYVVDTAGNRMWRIFGDGVYTLDGTEAIGYFSSETPEDF